jgi:hypothetical protein
MNDEDMITATRLGGYAAIVGTATMLAGTALLFASGADLDTALASGDTAGFLTAAGETNQFLVANLTLWIIGVFIFGIAGTAMAFVSKRRVIAQMAMYCYWTAVPLVIASYVAWLAIVVQVAPDSSATAVLLTEMTGWFASRADWIATILILGSGPALIAQAGRGEWVPTWLLRWSYVALLAGVLTAVSFFTGGITTYGMLILPVGMGWTAAAGVVLLRRSKVAQGSENRVAQSHLSGEEVLS